MPIDLHLELKFCDNRVTLLHGFSLLQKNLLLKTMQNKLFTFLAGDTTAVQLS